MEVSVKYDIRLPSKALAISIYKSILPDTRNLPEQCSALIELNEGTLHVEFKCSSISKLRAVSNSFIGVIALLLKVAGELNVDWKDTGEDSASRSSATTHSVSNAQGALCSNRNRAPSS